MEFAGNWCIEELTGYAPVTTFYQDFSIAEKFGINAVNGTYKTAFAEWKDNTPYITELCMVLNWKGWRWYETVYELADEYFKLYTELRDWCICNLKGDDLDYFFEVTD